LELSPDNQYRHSSSNDNYHNLSPRTQQHLIGSPEGLQGVHLLDEQQGSTNSNGNSSVPVPPPSLPTLGAAHKRRNTENTVFVSATMMSPDVPGTIKCLSAVYRAHVIESVESLFTSTQLVPVGSTVVHPDVFRDDLSGMPAYRGEMYQPTAASSHKPRGIPQKIPTVQEVENFYMEFFRRSQMEHDTIIMSLIYIERLIKRTDGAIRPTPLNWRSMLFSCMILASKVWDDLSMYDIAAALAWSHLPIFMLS
jgi:hypothetical protein